MIKSSGTTWIVISFIVVAMIMIFLPNADMDLENRSGYAFKDIHYVDIDSGNIEGTQYNVTADDLIDLKDLTKVSNMSEEQWEAMLKGYWISKLIPGFMKAEKELGINGIFIAAIAAHESGSGRSGNIPDYKCVEYNNCFGNRRGGPRQIPNSGFTAFDSHEDGVMFTAKNLKENYLTPGGKYYKDGSLYQVGLIYSPPSDNGGADTWGSHVEANIKSMLANYYRNVPTPEIGGGASVGEATGNMVWPTPGFTRISSPYGYRIHPTIKARQFHRGIDIAGSPDKAIMGTGVLASDNGTVVIATEKGSYGKYIKIDHENGYVTLYAHLSAISVKQGQKVAKGATIGKVGSTGRSTGPHLHYEIMKNGATVNPLDYVKEGN